MIYKQIQTNKQTVGVPVEFKNRTDDYLKVNSVFFWLVALSAAGIIFIGLRFITAPLTGAEGFGVPVAENHPLAYLWAKGTRDIVSGLVGIVFFG